MKLPFEVMFFHRGWFYEDPVAIHEIIGQGVQDIAFDADTFDYGRNKIDRNEVKGLGFAGFRVHFPVNTQAYKDEVLVFLGASYFRALGQGPAVWSVRARAGHRHRARAAARNSHGSSSSGSSARSREPRSSPSTPCSTRRGRPAPTASC